jgi:hypothetical protein
MNKEIARGMVCFFHQKKHFYLIFKDLQLLFPVKNVVLCRYVRRHVKFQFAEIQNVERHNTINVKRNILPTPMCIVEM